MVWLQVVADASLALALLVKSMDHSVAKRLLNAPHGLTSVLRLMRCSHNRVKLNALRILYKLADSVPEARVAIVDASGVRAMFAVIQEPSTQMLAVQVVAKVAQCAASSASMGGDLNVLRQVVELFGVAQDPVVSVTDRGAVQANSAQTKPHHQPSCCCTRFARPSCNSCPAWLVPLPIASAWWRLVSSCLSMTS